MHTIYALSVKKNLLQNRKEIRATTECTMHHDTKWGDNSLQQSLMPGKHSGHWFKKINSTWVPFNFHCRYWYVWNTRNYILQCNQPTNSQGNFSLLSSKTKKKNSQLLHPICITTRVLAFINFQHELNYSL